MADLTQKVKAGALSLGADLVGIAPVERWRNAPSRLSPQGIFPEAKSVVVMGIHIPDACVELACPDHPQNVGPGAIQGTISNRLNFLAFRLARLIEAEGFRAVPIICTCIWRYRPDEGTGTAFAPDLSHIHAAACAGLGEIGWHGLLITPEYGPRMRFVSVITDAPLEPDPLYQGPPLCDMCMECALHCPTGAFDKEVAGVCEVKIGGRVFRYANKNKWRCAWGENFQLDLDLPIPERVDERAIAEVLERAAREHREWRRGWAMGQCLKFCLPPHLRDEASSPTGSPRRRKRRPEGVSARKLLLDVVGAVLEAGADEVAVLPAEECERAGLDLGRALPGARALISIAVRLPEGAEGSAPARRAARDAASFAELDVARLLDDVGFSAVAVGCGVSPKEAAEACGLAEGAPAEFGLVVTDAPLPALRPRRPEVEGQREARRRRPSPKALKEELRALALSEGADLFGVAPAERVEAVAEQLEGIVKGWGEYFVAVDEWRWNGPFVGRVERVELRPKRPSDYVEGARSVIVIGIGLFEAAVERAGRPPAETAGPYVFAHAEALRQLCHVALKLAKRLEAHGFRACPVYDLEGLASKVASSLGVGIEVPDMTVSRFAAICAGLGELGWSGLLLTPQFGPRQRVLAIVTDAPLEPDPVYQGPPICRRCKTCVSSCPVGALSSSEAEEIVVDGRRFVWGRADRLRCDWAKRYGLVPEEGPRFVGSRANVPPPERITPEALLRALEGHDLIQRIYLCVAEPCLINCPAGRERQ